MREFLLMAGVQCKSLFGLNKARFARDPEEKKKARKSILVLLVMVIAIGNVSVTYSLMLLEALPGQEAEAFTLMVTGISAFLAFFTLFSARNVLFAFKDYDLVMSLPVKSWAVAGSRIAMYYLYDLFYAVIFLVPLYAVFAIKLHPGPAFYALALVTLPLVPAVPVAAGGFLGLLLTLLTARMKKNSLLNTALQLLLFAGIMGGSMMLSSGMDGLIQKAASARAVYAPAEWLSSALIGGEVLKALLFFFGSVIALAAFVWVAGRAILPVSSLLLSAADGGGKAVAPKRAGRRTSPLGALVRNEWKRYLSSTVYVMNTAFGALVLILVAGAAVFKGRALMNSLSPADAELLLSALPMGLSLIAAMSNTTSSSVSMEGTGIDIIKSLPVKASDWLLSKIAVSLIVILPALIVSVSVIGLSLGVSGGTLLMMYLVPAAYALLSALAGLIINLRYPKLDWTSEAEAVKQSLATMLSLLVNFVLIGIPFALTAAFPGLPISAAALMLALAASAAAALLLFSTAEKRLKRIK